MLGSEEACATLGTLPEELLTELLASDGLDITDEGLVVQAALRWAAAEPAERGPALPGLLRAARMPAATLGAAWGGGEARELPAALLPAFRDAVARREREEAAGRAHHRPRLSTPTGLMAAGGLDEGWRSLR